MESPNIHHLPSVEKPEVSKDTPLTPESVARLNEIPGLIRALEVEAETLIEMNKDLKSKELVSSQEEIATHVAVRTRNMEQVGKIIKQIEDLKQEKENLQRGESANENHFSSEQQRMENQ